MNWLNGIRLVLPAAAVALCLAASPATATSVLAPTTFGGVVNASANGCAQQPCTPLDAADSVQVEGYGPYSVYAMAGSSAYSFATIVPSPSPSLRVGGVAASGPENGLAGFDTYAFLHYQMAVFSDTHETVDVRLRAYGTARVKAGTDSGFFAQVDALGASYAPLFTHLDSTAGEGVYSFSVDQVVSIYANTIYQIQLYGSVRGAAGPSIGAYGAGAYVFLDPVFSLVAPADQLGDYSLAFSDGIGNSAAPEPASWLLMITGCGFTGVALRRRMVVVR